MWLDTECVRLTLQSYTEALEKLTTICPRFRFRCGWSPLQAPVGISIEQQCGNVDMVKAWPMVTHFYSDSQTLIEWGRPKIFDACPYLLRVTPIISVKFNSYEWEPGFTGHDAYTDDEGNDHDAALGYPAEIKKRERDITLVLSQKTWGAKDFVENKPTVASYFDAAPERVRLDYLKKVGEAEKHFYEWKKLIADIAGKVQGGIC